MGQPVSPPPQRNPPHRHHRDERWRHGHHRQRSSSPRETAVEAVRLIVAAADGKGNQRKKGISVKYLFPFDLVERCDEGKAIKKGDASREEYTLGLKRLETQPGFSSSAINALLRHQEMVAQDNCSLAWATVRRYSEEIFTQVADGRLPRGWWDEEAINAVRVEMIAMACNAPPPAIPAPAAAPADQRWQRAPDRGAFDCAACGAPCPAWNRDAEACTKARRMAAALKNKPTSAVIARTCSG